MNPFEMVVMIVLIVTIGGVFRGRRNKRGATETALPDQDAIRMQDEIKQLKERIAVLERLATDNNRAIDLDREIEKLR